MIWLLAEGVAVDWTGIAGVISAIGAIVVAILQAKGKAAAAEKAQQATQQAVAVVRGVESAQRALNSDDKAELAKTIKDLTGVELSQEQVALAAGAYQKHVKKSVKKTAMALNVEDLLHDLVKTTTRLDPAKLREKLEADDA